MSLSTFGCTYLVLKELNFEAVFFSVAQNKYATDIWIYICKSLRLCPLHMQVHNTPVY